MIQTLPSIYGLCTEDSASDGIFKYEVSSRFFYFSSVLDATSEIKLTVFIHFGASQQTVISLNGSVVKIIFVRVPIKVGFLSKALVTS